MLAAPAQRWLQPLTPGSIVDQLIGYQLMFRDHFSTVAAAYAAHRPHYPAGLFDWLASVAPGRDLAWDCACGSGQAAMPLAQRFTRVIASDASHDQVAAATRHANLYCVVATAECSGLVTGTVDLITVAQALHWFDFDRFYREARRVLRPHGVLAAWTYGRCAIAGIDRDLAFQAFYDRIDAWWPPERALVEDSYRSIPFPFEPIAVPAFVIREHWTLQRLLGYCGSWSAVVRCRAAQREDPVAALRESLAPLWGDPRLTREISWTLTLRVGRRS